MMQVKNLKKRGPISFHFKFPKKGLSLRAVSLVTEGVRDTSAAAKLIFDSANCSELPTITEEDVATVARLVSEGKRPEFFYIGIREGHPFHGRQYKKYNPSWLKGTSVGELLAEIDWKMKCLQIGARTNENKTQFFEASKTSKLESRLGTCLDFPRLPITRGSIIMSCKSVEVEESDNKLVFVGEPKIQIISIASPAYSEYITNVYDSIGYYDEPLYLKMKELIKLILGMEFLEKKGIKFNTEWFTEHTDACASRQAGTIEVSESDIPVDFSTLPSSIPLHLQVCTIAGSTTDLIISDINKKESAIEMTLKIANLKLSRLEAIKMHKSLTLEEKKQFIPQEIMNQIPPDEHAKFLQAMDEEMNEMDDAEWDDIQANIQLTTKVIMSCKNYDLLYDGIDPRMDLSNTITSVVPDVESWSELYQETVPWPHVWSFPFALFGVPTAQGGVTTSNIPVSICPAPCFSTLASKVHTQCHQGQYQFHDGLLSVCSSASTPSTSPTCPPPDMIPVSDPVQHSPIRNVHPKSDLSKINDGVVQSSERGMMFGYKDGKSLKVFDSNGKLISCGESVKSTIVQPEVSMYNESFKLPAQIQTNMPIKIDVSSQLKVESQANLSSSSSDGLQSLQAVPSHVGGENRPTNVICGNQQVSSLKSNNPLASTDFSIGVAQQRDSSLGLQLESDHFPQIESSVGQVQQQIKPLMNQQSDSDLESFVGKPQQHISSLKLDDSVSDLESFIGKPQQHISSLSLDDSVSDLESFVGKPKQHISSLSLDDSDFMQTSFFDTGEVQQHTVSSFTDSGLGSFVDEECGEI